MRSRILVGAAFCAMIIVLGIAVYQDDTPSTSNPSAAMQTSIVASSSSSTSSASTTTYTLAQVAEHNSASSCWSAINGKVYDLTSWINEHPGGPEHILAICGIDGSAAFNAQHAGQAQPEEELQNFYIGDLAQ